MSNLRGTLLCVCIYVTVSLNESMSEKVHLGVYCASVHLYDHADMLLQVLSLGLQGTLHYSSHTCLSGTTFCSPTGCTSIHLHLLDPS